MTWLAFVPLGLLIGGLINALADSLPRRNRLQLPHCHACGGPRPAAAWLATAALFSGRSACRYCRTPIRTRAYLVEITSAVLAVWLYRSGLGPSGYAMALLVVELFLLIAVIDIEHRLILHVVSLPSIALLALVGSLLPGRGPEKTLIGGAVGFGFVFLLFLFGEVYARWVARRRGEPLDEVAFGFGDVTLSALIGVIVGWPGVVLALTIGVLSAGAFSLIYLVASGLRGSYQPYMPIPYGPFLIVGALLVYLGGSDLFLNLFPG